MRAVDPLAVARELRGDPRFAWLDDSTVRELVAKISNRLGVGVTAKELIRARREWREIIRKLDIPAATAYCAEDSEIADPGELLTEINSDGRLTFRDLLLDHPAVLLP